MEERLSPCDVFTVPELSDGMFFWWQRTLITDQARAIIDRAGLVGLRFETLPRPKDARLALVKSRGAGEHQDGIGPAPACQR